MRLFWILVLFVVTNTQADTIKNFMDIANNISTMEMKADAQAQAWARSARNVLNVTCESIAETMLQANQSATNQGRPLFCLPSGTELNASLLSTLIQETYKSLSSQASDKDGMTVSQVAWMGVSKQYACGQKQGDLRSMMHVGSQ